MATKSKKAEENSTKKPSESIRQSLDAAYIASKELIETSRSLIQTESSPTISKPAPLPIQAITKLTSLIHSHTVRTALTCGPTASSPTATLSCIKELHEPILPLVTEFQAMSTSNEYPAFFVRGIRREIMMLFDAIVAFLGEVVEIARGEGSVESRERLQYSGMVMELCDRLGRICKEGPIGMIYGKLKDTQEMLADALEEVEGI